MATHTTADESTNCPHCGYIHSGPCPRIKAIEYYPDGTVKRVEYNTPEPLQAATLPWQIGS